MSGRTDTTGRSGVRDGRLSPMAWMATLACCASLLAPVAAVAEDHPFDGRWSVFLACADTTDRNGPVKGYEYRFEVSIAEGVLQGAYGAPGHPASVTYAGRVEDDGKLEITATGNTGRPEYAVGKIPRGSSYGYTLQGRLGPSSGQATRREVRPCVATFTKP